MKPAAIAKGFQHRLLILGRDIRSVHSINYADNHPIKLINKININALQQMQLRIDLVGNFLQNPPDDSESDYSHFSTPHDLLRLHLN